MDKAQYCPVCGKEVRQSERYPNYVCGDDTPRATDSAGRPVKLSNTHLSGGFIALYEDGSEATEVTKNHDVYIDGKKFYANEAHMGGTVIIPWPAPNLAALKDEAYS